MANRKLHRRLNGIGALIVTVFIFGWILIPICYMQAPLITKSLIALCVFAAILLLADRFLQKNPFSRLSPSYYQNEIARRNKGKTNQAKSSLSRGRHSIRTRH